MKKWKNILSVLFTLFLWWFFGITASAIYTASYEIIKRGIVIWYIVFAYFVIKWVRSRWKYFIWYEWDVPQYGIKRIAKILSWILLIIFIFWLIYLIWSWIIENIAKLIAEWLSNNLHIEWWKIPRIEIK